jgi:hypothetical protein
MRLNRWIDGHHIIVVAVNSARRLKRAVCGQESTALTLSSMMYMMTSQKSTPCPLWVPFEAAPLALVGNSLLRSSDEIRRVNRVKSLSSSLTRRMGMVELDEEGGGDGYPVGVLSTVRRCPSRESLRSVSIVEESAQRKRTAHLKPAVTPPTRLAAMATISISPNKSQP